MIDPDLRGDAADVGPTTANDVDVISEVTDQIRHAVEAEDADQISEILAPLHDADVADVVERLGGDDRRNFVRIVGGALQPAVLAELDEHVRDEVIEVLGPIDTAHVVAEMEIDDAVLVLADLDEAEQQQVLEAIPSADRALIEEGLAYPEFSAGRLMRRNMVAIPQDWTVGEVIDHLRAAADNTENTLPEEFHDIFVVESANKLVGMLTLSRLLRNRRPVPVSDIMVTDVLVFHTAADQEDVAFQFRQRDLTSAPVTDDDGRLMGVITIDDIVDVIDEEHEDDIMRLGGLGEDDFYSAALATCRARFSWLLVNLGTAVLASLVIGLFEGTISQMVGLAVLMPIVASMGGNAGTQTLTVTVRAIATRELSATNAGRVIVKELLVGLVNGALFAVITGAVTWIWFGDAGLAAIIGLAMIFNLVVAALAGATLPLLLERFGIDPAIASSVFVTTVTDVAGFVSFLGLAALILM